MEKLSYDINTLLDTFGVEPYTESNVLTSWLSKTYILSDRHHNLLKDIHAQFKSQGDEWNEEELKIKFLAFLFFIAEMEEPKKIQTFYERTLTAEINLIPLSVKCDCMVATPKGKGAPKVPYFFLQEFKKQKGDKNDPEGQMFAAMLIAQHKNADKQPVYGAWLVGNQWRFTTLEGQQYVYSRYYDASKWEDLLAIVYALKALKELIMSRLSR